jgi:hypothetical protein
MTLAIDQMHDATLVAFRFDWSARTCVLEFSGAPSLLEPFTIEFSDVRELVVPAMEPWGPSASVLEVIAHETGSYDFVMQSGDTIRVVAPNHSFKPTPLRGAA